MSLLPPVPVDVVVVVVVPEIGVGSPEDSTMELHNSLSSSFHLSGISSNTIHTYVYKNWLSWTIAFLPILPKVEPLFISTSFLKTFTLLSPFRRTLTFISSGALGSLSY